MLRSFHKVTFHKPMVSTLFLAGTLTAASANGITIEAEKFTSMSGIQTENTMDIGGGNNIGFIDSGDWMSYPINILAAGKYKVSYRIASMNGGGSLQIEQQGGSPVYGTVNIPGTGGWQTWSTVSHVVSLPAGQQNPL